MMRTELDKDKRARTREMASFARYKEVLAEEKTKAAGKKKGAAAAESAPATEEAKKEVDPWA
jgi:hypothetical protein